MKNLLILVLFAFLVSPAFSQNELPQRKIKETFDLDGTSFKKEFKLSVIETKSLRYTIKGKITGGKFEATVYNPDGKKEDGFVIKTVEGGNAKGSLIEINTDPMPGIWTIKIENIDAKGSIELIAFQNNRGL